MRVIIAVTPGSIVKVDFEKGQVFVEYNQPADYVGSITIFTRGEHDKPIASKNFAIQHDGKIFRDKC